MRLTRKISQHIGLSDEKIHPAKRNSEATVFDAQPVTMIACQMSFQGNAMTDQIQSSPVGAPDSSSENTLAQWQELPLFK